MITTKLSHYQARHERSLQRVLQEADVPAARLREAMIYALFPGGKRLRPCLAYLSGELLGIPVECLDIMAAAIELTHAYSLVHDDLPAMDNDDFRRGKPSCHRAFDEACAILVGDALQALAIDLLLTELPAFLPSDKVLAVTRELVHASGPAGMVSGQSLDLSELAQGKVDEVLLRRIHNLKTGRLISACVRMPLAAGSPDPVQRQALTEYADHLGLVFQMQDDYLDEYAPVTSLGKARASDSANQKTTFAALYQQQALADLINEHFARVENALTPLADAASDLRALSQAMQQRGCP